jgi:hypothetical protein
VWIRLESARVIESPLFKAISDRQCTRGEFVGRTADAGSWVDVGRSYQRFALQATALGIRNAMLNQPVEVAPLRTEFAGQLGIGGRRPDLVVRFGRGPRLPASLRRPVPAVMT